MSARKGGKGYQGPPKGSFLDGIWHCDCNPPLPAIHLPVKKAGPNKGRWFRTCQKEQSDKSRCKFFLWDTDAAPRENAALANNSRTEPGRAKAASPPRAKAVAPPSPPPPARTFSNSTRKRTRASYQSDEDEGDEYGFGDDSAAFDEELDNIVTAVETPSKKVRTNDFFTTPKRRKLPWQKDEPSTNTHGLQTPQTESRTLTNPFATKTPADALITPSKPSSLDSGSMQAPTPSSPPMETPTPSRFKNVAAEGDVVRDIFDVLHRANVKFDEQTSREITAVLSKHVTISEGVKKGRDVARASVKAKDAKITELTYRVNTLEAELEAERATVAHLQWKAEHEKDFD